MQRELFLIPSYNWDTWGGQGHCLMGSVDQKYGIAQTCLDLRKIPGMSCAPLGLDNDYTIPAGAILAGVTVHLPYRSEV